MARGEVFACIGLSEPNSGSDLASVKTTAQKKGDRWVIDGQKVWTTGAHFSHVMIALVRTTPGSQRNEGLSQFVIPMDAPGVTIRPIIDLTGGHDFNEVFFDSVELAEHALVGTEGNGWRQVTAELSLERSGPERYLSSTALFLELLRHVGPTTDSNVRQLVGKLAAEMWTLRMMSATVAAKLAAGEDPALEATIVKDLGNSFEQAMPALVQAAVDLDLSGEAPLARVLGHLLQVSPSFSLRGGTREILKGIIARGLGLR
jgi:alkylation response protein AidB-like acyl-CoA dehydrogenase